MAELILLQALISTVTPKDALRFEYVHQQIYDTSCGLSCVSSMLDLYWRVPTDEHAILEAFDSEDGYTVSVGDLGWLLGEHGIESRAFRMDYAQMVKATNTHAPVIAHYVRPDHFVVVLWSNEDAVIVGDPASGVRYIVRAEFVDRWSGVVLVTASRTRHKDDERLNLAVSDSLRRIEFLGRISR